MPFIYTMTPAQTDTWILGNKARATVEEEIAEHIMELQMLGEVQVLCDDKTYAFTLDNTVTL